MDFTSKELTASFLVLPWLMTTGCVPVGARYQDLIRDTPPADHELRPSLDALASAGDVSAVTTNWAQLTTSRDGGIEVTFPARCAQLRVEVTGHYQPTKAAHRTLGNVLIGLVGGAAVASLGAFTANSVSDDQAMSSDHPNVQGGLSSTSAGWISGLSTMAAATTAGFVLNNTTYARLESSSLRHYLRTADCDAEAAVHAEAHVASASMTFAGVDVELAPGAGGGLSSRNVLWAADVARILAERDESTPLANLDVALVLRGSGLGGAVEATSKKRVSASAPTDASRSVRMALVRTLLRSGVYPDAAVSAAIRVQGGDLMVSVDVVGRLLPASSGRRAALESELADVAVTAGDQLVARTLVLPSKAKVALGSVKAAPFVPATISRPVMTEKGADPARIVIEAPVDAFSDAWLGDIQAWLSDPATAPRFTAALDGHASEVTFSLTQRPEVATATLRAVAASMPSRSIPAAKVVSDFVAGRRRLDAAFPGVVRLKSAACGEHPMGGCAELASAWSQRALALDAEAREILRVKMESAFKDAAARAEDYSYGADDDPTADARDICGAVIEFADAVCADDRVPDKKLCKRAKQCEPRAISVARNGIAQERRREAAERKREAAEERVARPRRGNAGCISAFMSCVPICQGGACVAAMRCLDSCMQANTGLSLDECTPEIGDIPFRCQQY